VVVFEPWNLRMSVVNILNDIELSERLEIAADEPLVVVQPLSERTNRPGRVVRQVIDGLEPAVVEDLLATLASDDDLSHKPETTPPRSAVIVPEAPPFIP